MAHRHNRTEPVTDKMSAEVLVIGSGPGGAVTATLCAEAGKSVLMIEEGQNLTLQSAPAFSQKEIFQKYRNSGVTVALGDTKISYVEGRCVGGGSEINRGLYHRTPGYIFEQWSKDFGVRDISLEIMTPHFEACEKTARVEYLPGTAPLISTRLNDGAVNLGWKSIEAPRLFRYGQGDEPGRKQSMSETFVPRFLEAGGRLVTDVSARRVARIAGEWNVTAVYRPAGGPERQVEITADTLFIACGAVQTPALLRRSGFTENIGNTLQFHSMVKVVALFDDEVNKPGDLDPVHQIREFEPNFGMGCSISTRPLLGMAMASHAGHLGLVDSDWRRMGIYYVQTSSGMAKVRNLPFFQDPLVTVNETLDDLKKLAEGLKRLAEALLAGGAVAIYPSVAGLPVLRNMDDVRKLPDIFAGNDGSVSSVHVFSSCRMGENEALCATNSFGAVRGAEKLFIADASLLCGPTTVNPQGTVMAVAHRNATIAIENRFG